MSKPGTCTARKHRFFVKETENLSQQIVRNAKEVPQPKIDQAFVNRMEGILKPERRAAYQEVQVLPRLGDLRLSGPKVLIVIKPDGTVPPSEFQDFFDYQQEKNNLIVLSGQDSHFADAVEDRLRELYAIEQIHQRLKPDDTLYEESRDRLQEAEDRFEKALSAGYDRIYFPAFDEFGNRAFLTQVTIDNGLKLGEGEQSAEAQIETLLASPRADYKLAADLKEDFSQYFSMAEQILWPSGTDNRRTPWRDIVTRSKCNSAWPWMPGSGGMDTLKAEALSQGRWRLGEDGYVEKGPFPKEKSTVNVNVVATHPETGTTTLSLTPRHAGESPIVYYARTPKLEDLDSSDRVDDLDSFMTSEGTLYFLAEDTTGHYESGPPIRWLADLKIRHKVEPAADKRMVTLQCMPLADLYYSLDGSNPRHGTHYEGAFQIGSQAAMLLVYAQSGEANITASFQIPNSGDDTPQIDDAKPARLQSRRIALDTTDRVFGVINRFRDQPNTRFRGVRIEIGEGENTVTVRFQEREVTALMIEGVVSSLRAVLHEDQAPVAITISSDIQFDTGFDARDFAQLAGFMLRPGDIVQE